MCMKIAIDVSQLVYRGTGVGRYTYELFFALLELNSDHSFVFFAGALRQYPSLYKMSRTSPWEKAEWKFYPLPPKLATKYFNDWDLPIDRLLGPVDLLHTSDWTEPRSLCPKVTTVHDLVFYHYPETVDPLILATQQKRIQRVLLDGTHIIADSKSTKNDLISIHQLPADKITVVYPGINKIYKPAKSKEIARVKKKYNLPTQYLLTLGTQEPRKNLTRLVEATSSLSLPLVVAGRHGWGKEVEPSSNLVSTGYVEEEDLPALYSGASVFAYPSLYEGFGFPVGEAMACGTPVVTSRVSSLPEVAGQAAILVDPLEPDDISRGIKKALANSPKLINQGLRQAAKFSWEQTARQILTIYEKIGAR